MIHLVYLDNKENVLEKIMSGKKTMIIRGAAGRKIPHSRVFNDEVLYFMEKGTKIFVQYVPNDKPEPLEKYI